MKHVKNFENEIGGYQPTDRLDINNPPDGATLPDDSYSDREYEDILGIIKNNTIERAAEIICSFIDDVRMYPFQTPRDKYFEKK